MTTKAQRERHPHKMTATQRQQLERLYDSNTGSLVVSNRNGHRFVHNMTAVGLVRLGLAVFGSGYLHDKIRITEAGRQRVQDWRTIAQSTATKQ